MILLLLFVPYDIEAGSMQIVDRNKNIFRDGVQVRSTDLFLKAETGIEMRDYLLLEGGVYLQSGIFRLTSRKLKFHVPSKTLYAMGKVKIWDRDTIRGDSLIFYRERESGKMFGHLRYVSDTITVTGNYGKFSRDSLEVRGNPTFISPSMTVSSGLIKFSVKDSSFLFLSNVTFNGTGISGRAERLHHSIRTNRSTISESPYILQERDSITGDKIEVDHSLKVAEVYKGTSINHTEEGRNTVSGDTLRIFYSGNTMDSVVVISNANGIFAKKEL